MLHAANNVVINRWWFKHRRRGDLTQHTHTSTSFTGWEVSTQSHTPRRIHKNISTQAQNKTRAKTPRRCKMGGYSYTTSMLEIYQASTRQAHPSRRLQYSVFITQWFSVTQVHSFESTRSQPEVTSPRRFWQHSFTVLKLWRKHLSLLRSPTAPAALQRKVYTCSHGPPRTGSTM